MVVTRESFAINAPERLSCIDAGYRAAGFGANATKAKNLSHKGAGVGRTSRFAPKQYRKRTDWSDELSWPDRRHRRPLCGPEPPLIKRAGKWEVLTQTKRSPLAMHGCCSAKSVIRECPLTGRLIEAGTGNSVPISDRSCCELIAPNQPFVCSKNRLKFDY